MKPILGTTREDEDLSKLEKLTRKYINSGNKNAEAELKDMKIEGTEFIKLLNNLGIETEKETIEHLNTKVDYEQLGKDYDKLKQDYDKLIGNYNSLVWELKLIIKDSLPEKIKTLLKNLKEE